MTIRIRYFGQLVELVGKEEEYKDLVEGFTLKKLELELLSSYQINATYYRIALNQIIEENKETMLNNNDEVALLPPFAGG